MSNQVASDERSWDLKRRLKLSGLERKFEDSKEEVLKTFNSCKLCNVMTLKVSFKQMLMV